MLPVVGQNLKPDELRAMIKDAFGEGGPAGRDAVTVRISGGDRLTAQIKAKGKVLRLFTHLDQLKGK